MNKQEKEIDGYHCIVPMNECPKCKRSMPYLKIALIVGKYFSEGDEQIRDPEEKFFVCPLCDEVVAKNYETADVLLPYK